MGLAEVGAGLRIGGGLGKVIDIHWVPRYSIIFQPLYILLIATPSTNKHIPTHTHTHTHIHIYK